MRERRVGEGQSRDIFGAKPPPPARWAAPWTLAEATGGAMLAPKGLRTATPEPRRHWEASEIHSIEFLI